MKIEAGIMMHRARWVGGWQETGNSGVNLFQLGQLDLLNKWWLCYN